MLIYSVLFVFLWRLEILLVGRLFLWFSVVMWFLVMWLSLLLVVVIYMVFDGLVSMDCMLLCDRFLVVLSSMKGWLCSWFSLLI